MKKSNIDLSEIPFDWEVIPCGYFFKEKSIKNNIGEINLSVYRDYGVIPKDSRSDNHNRVSEDISNYKLVDKGDFVLNKMKCWMGSLGVSNHRGIVSPSYTVLEPKKEIYNQYFHYLLRSEEYRQIYESLSYGVRVNQWELRFHDFKMIPALYPKIQEQKLISQYLDKKTSQIDSLIEKIEKKIELLKEQKTALINQYVTKGLDPNIEMKYSGVDWIGDIPKNWKTAKLGYFSEIYRGSGYQFLIPMEDKFNSDGERVIRISDFNNFSPQRYQYNKIFENYRIKEGDILVGGTGHYFGKSILAKSEWVGFIHSYNVIRIQLKNHIPGYIQLYLSSQLIRDKLNLSVLGSGQPFVDIEGLRSLQILLPPEDEQREIFEYLNKKSILLLNLIDTNLSKINLLNEYRQSLISSVVTGKIRVTEDML